MKWLQNKKAGSWYSDDGKWDVLPTGEGTFLLRHNVGLGEHYWEVLPHTFYNLRSAQVAAEGHPVEIVGHSGFDDTEVVIVAERRIHSKEDVHWLARYLTSGNDAGASAYGHNVAGWTFVRDTVTGETIAMYDDGLLMSKERQDFIRGRSEGEAWARATGTKSADLHMVPAVKGSPDFKLGHRMGVAKVRRERYLAETGTPDHSGGALDDVREP